MGATNFLTLSNGKTASDAYHAAVLQATAEYGHQEGYNGTISTTNEFVELNSEVFKGLGRKARLIILDSIAEGFEPEKSALGAKGWDVLHTLMSSRLPRAEKWGRCYAVRLNHNTFAFAGLAAE